jgi:hypothetical protein
MVLRRVRADSRPLPGTRLVRKWQGVQHVVTVRPDHFEFRHVAGTRWNGWTFFGLRLARGSQASGVACCPGQSGEHLEVAIDAPFRVVAGHDESGMHGSQQRRVHPIALACCRSVLIRSPGRRRIRLDAAVTYPATRRLRECRYTPCPQGPASQANSNSRPLRRSRTRRSAVELPIRFAFALGLLAVRAVVAKCR